MKYTTCNLCCYDIVDDNGDIMEHECITEGALTPS
mgnify:CR=1 FL=1